MSRISDRQVDAIAAQVLRQLSGRAPVAASWGGVDDDQQRLGVFTELDSAVKAARAAFEALDKHTLAKRDEIVASIRRATLRESESAPVVAAETTEGQDVSAEPAAAG